MKQTTLVIMAAGMGSRFGGGIKQLEPVGAGGQIIMDYSIHDALKAGFNKVVFIIRKDLEKDFKEIIGDRIAKICNVEYAFQEIDNLPDGFIAPKDRKKPWGTGQAVLACKGIVNEPFVVINADDYYGVESFQKIHDFLIENYDNEDKYCMAGFILKNTLSDNGGVSRGVVEVDENEFLVGVKETHNIVKKGGRAFAINGDVEEEINVNSHVSMNMWGVSKNFVNELQSEFEIFLSGLDQGDVKSEFLLPLVVDKLVKAKKVSVKVLETRDNWFGVTYKEDKEFVVKAFEKLVEEGVYTKELY
ncbi:MAG: sugar phosphate nucleotidyltransferase [Clostridia bacterium]